MSCTTMNEDKDIELMTPKELKLALKSRKMSTKGTRDELVERLKLALEGESEGSEGESEDSSEDKTPRSGSPSTKMNEKGLPHYDGVNDFAPVTERDVELPLQRQKTEEDSVKLESSEAPQVASPNSTEKVVPEWRSLHIPDEWLPMPLLRITKLPSDVELDVLRSLMEKTGGLKVAYLTFETSKPGGRSNAALMRLRPPKEELFAEGISEECDVKAIAEGTAKKLSMMDLKLGQHALEFEVPLCRTTLFVHNLQEYYGNKDDRFHAEMSKIGDVIRCFIVRNKSGESKDYGFVEYLLPVDAATAKEILDKKSADALSEFKKQRNNSTGGAAMVPLKRLRCEWAFNSNISSIYSKICYVANLPPNFEDREVLRKVFAPFGNVLSCNIRTRPGMGPGCGFVDFEKGEDAEKALKALDESRDTPLGFILVSFVNPGKFPGEIQPQTVGQVGRNNFSRRPRDVAGGNGNHSAYPYPQGRHPYFPVGRPPFEMPNRGRFQRPVRGRNFRGFPPYTNYNQGVYGPYYGPYGPAFMQHGYLPNNGGYNQFPPQSPGSYPSVGYTNPPSYGGFRQVPTLPSGKSGFGGDIEYPPSDFSGMPYPANSQYTGNASSHPATNSYGQSVNQTAYPSSYGTYQPGYGQNVATYNQGTAFGQQGNYGQVGYGGNLHGGQIPGGKREPEYDTSAYGSGHYVKKPRF